MDIRAIEQAFAAGQYRFTEHACEQMAKRQLTEANVRDALASPDDILAVREGRVVAQAMVSGYLLRVFVDVDRSPAEVVTVYRTSRMKRYRSQS